LRGGGADSRAKAAAGVLEGYLPVTVLASQPKAAPARWTGSGERLAFCVSVAVVLTFSQFWVMPLAGPNGNADASSLIIALYFPAYLAALALALTAAPQTLMAALRAPLLAALIALIFISRVWSIDPGVTFRRGIAVFFTTLAGLAIAARYEWPRLLEVLAAAFALIAVCCIGLALALPSYGRMSDLFPGAWRGVWFEKNALGDNMSIGCIVFCAAAILNPVRRRLWCVMAGVAFALILLSTSKTSLVSLMIGLAMLGFVALVKRGPVIAVITTFVGVTAAAALGFALYFASDVFFALLGKDATLTGRTQLWAGVLPQIYTRPWTGFGYGAVWNDKTIWGPLAWISKRAGFVALHAHNSWLEIWLGIGYVGLGIWALYFAETWVRGLVAAYRAPGGYFALPFLAVYSLMTLTETVAAVYNDFVWVIFVAVAVKLATPSAPAEPANRAAPWP
jgi:O-antigen ligase